MPQEPQPRKSGFRGLIIFHSANPHPAAPAGAPDMLPRLPVPAARSLKVALIIAPVHSDAEIKTAIIALGREPGGGLVVLAGGFSWANNRAPIISTAARNNVPAVYGLSEFARDGGLLSYGND